MKINYPETCIDKETGKTIRLVRIYPRFASYRHPAGYLISMTPVELGLMKQQKELIDNITLNVTPDIFY